METETTILDKLRNEETPYWYLYDGKTLTARSGETSNIEESLNRLSNSLAELAPGTYRLKAANNPNKHNGAKWHDVTVGNQRTTRNPTRMNTTNNRIGKYGLTREELDEIKQEAVQEFMFKDMYTDYKTFKPDIIKRVEALEKFLSDDEDGNGIPDFQEMAKTVSGAADTVNTVKKVFTGKSLFD